MYTLVRVTQDDDESDQDISVSIGDTALQNDPENEELDLELSVSILDTKASRQNDVIEEETEDVIKEEEEEEEEDEDQEEEHSQSQSQSSDDSRSDSEPEEEDEELQEFRNQMNRSSSVATVQMMRRMRKT